jgi:hypothetical protein
MDFKSSMIFEKEREDKNVGKTSEKNEPKKEEKNEGNSSDQHKNGTIL